MDHTILSDINTTRTGTIHNSSELTFFSTTLLPISNQNPPLVTRENLIAALRRPKGGIFCSRETCKSAKGLRMQGHLECTHLLCRKCCQDYTRDRVSKGLPSPLCQEQKHRLDISAIQEISEGPFIPMDSITFPNPQLHATGTHVPVPSQSVASSQVVTNRINVRWCWNKRVPRCGRSRRVVHSRGQG